MSLSAKLEALKERGRGLMSKLNHQADTEEIAYCKRHYKGTGDIDFEIRLLNEYVKELDKMEESDKREDEYIFEAIRIAQKLVNKFTLIVPEKTIDAFGMMFFKKYGKNDLIPKLYEDYYSALKREKDAIAKSKQRMNLAEVKLEHFKESYNRLEPTFRSPIKLKEELVRV